MMVAMESRENPLTIERLLALVEAAGSISYGATQLHTIETTPQEDALVRALERMIDARISESTRDHSCD